MAVLDHAISSVDDIVALWRSLPADLKLNAINQLQSLNESNCIESELNNEAKLIDAYFDKITGDSDCLSSHYCVCGDIRKNTIITKILETGKRIDAIFTSPPYNAEINYDNYHDKLSIDNYIQFLDVSIYQCNLLLEEGGRFVVNIRDIKLDTGSRYPIICALYDIFSKLEYKYRGVHVWYKGREESSNAWGSFLQSSNPAIIDLFEYVFVFQKCGERKKPIDNMSKTEFIENVLGVWKIRPVKKIIGKDKINTHKHPCPFPVELAKRVIKLYSNVGDCVLDPFAGVGSTAVAALQSGRSSISVDISENYCEETIKRLRSFCDLGNRDKIHIESV